MHLPKHFNGIIRIEQDFALGVAGEMLIEKGQPCGRDRQQGFFGKFFVARVFIVIQHHRA